jgi:integrase
MVILEYKSASIILPRPTYSARTGRMSILCRELKVTFTPHMARHSLGKAFNRCGAGLQTIMGALDHSDSASSQRYPDADLEIVREALAKVSASLGKLAGKKA